MIVHRRPGDIPVARRTEIRDLTRHLVARPEKAAGVGAALSRLKVPEGFVVSIEDTAGDDDLRGLERQIGEALERLEGRPAATSGLRRTRFS